MTSGKSFWHGWPMGKSPRLTAKAFPLAPIMAAFRQTHAPRPRWSALVLAGALIFASAPAFGQSKANAIPDLTGRYEFLTPENTLALLQEDTTLKGYIDVWQGENASDTIFSYNLTIGSRHGNHVEFRTEKIHEKYYRFSGTVRRGKGKAPGDRDYLELVGELETITDNSVTGKPQIERRQVIFKEKSRRQAEQP